MRFFVLVVLFFLCFLSFSQELTDEPKASEIPIDSLYREDQIYAGLQFCFLNNRPAGVSNENISLGFNFGFLRDFPINKARTIAIAPGVGYAFKNYNTTIVTNLVKNQIEYSFSKDGDKNFIRVQHIEFPLELRWRNSTTQSHKFTRIYGGVKMSYVFYDRSYFSNQFITYELTYNREFRRWTCSVFTTIGWNTWNLYFSYGLQPLYETTYTPLKKLNALEFGLMFYIL
ncbi:MAG: outer membrane beta-barrel protein [Flavobacteriales bacterium]|nr:outer membrane beta-barrel protein [Flavobacteriales bacterium]